MKIRNLCYFAAVLICAGFLCAGLWNGIASDEAAINLLSPSALPDASTTLAPAPAAGFPGQPRDLELPEIRRQINQKHLSNHEAEFYQGIPSAESSVTP